MSQAHQEARRYKTIRKTCYTANIAYLLLHLYYMTLFLFAKLYVMAWVCAGIAVVYGLFFLLIHFKKYYPYALCCGWDTIDLKAAAKWFERTNMSRLAAGVSLGARFDVAKKLRWGGYEETSFLLQPDERFIAKYDRNPWSFCEEDSGGINYLESCYVYTFAYWIGLYYGFIED